jgi:recombination protein RecA
MTEVRERVRVPVPAPAPSFPGLEGIAKTLSQRHGGDVMYPGTMIPTFNHLETGVFLMDLALLGGIPEGQSTMLYGWESSGKTTMAMRLAAAAQRKHPDKAVIWVDCEQTFDPLWFAKHGGDRSRLFYMQPDSGEQAVDTIDAVSRSPETSLVILDSLPAMLPQKMIDASAEDALVAAQSRLNSRLCSTLIASGQASRKEYGRAATFVCINQWRMAIGVSKGDPRTLPGGRQIRFLCTTLLEMKNKPIAGKDARDIEIFLKNEHAFVCKKSKAGNSLPGGEFDMIRDPGHPLGEGAIDDYFTALTYAKKMGFIGGGGTKQTIQGIDQSFGKREEMISYLKENDDDFTKLKRLVIASQRVNMGLPALPKDGWLLGQAA